MTVTDQLLENNEKYAANFNGPLPLPPVQAHRGPRLHGRPARTCTASSASRRASRT